MPILDPRTTYVFKHPGAFALRTLNGFNGNNGLLLAGAVAYYALLSIVPLLILIVIALSHFVDRPELLNTLGQYLEWLVPSQSKAIIAELTTFLIDRAQLGWMMLVTMLFFSSLGFAVLSKAMAVIFEHRAAVRTRHFLVSAFMPYCAIPALGFGLLVVTLLANALQTMGHESIHVWGYQWDLGGLSGLLLYCLGLGAEILIFSSVYWIVPVGGVSARHALIGGTTAALLWELIRHGLVWYFTNLSQASVVYGSLTTSIVVLLSLEFVATLLLIGAQVISEYERIPLDS